MINKKKIHMKLTNKATLAVFLIAVIPIILIFSGILINMEQREKKEQINILKADGKRVVESSKEIVELCNITTQVILHNSALNKYLLRVHAGEKIPIKEIIQFRREDVTSIEWLTNTNPLLEQIHIYVDQDNLLEMMPLLFNVKRIPNKKILNDNTIQSSWMFDYNGTIIGVGYKQENDHTMSLTSRMPNYTYQNLGFIEVSMKLEEVYPDIYKENPLKWACFITGEGAVVQDHNNQAWAPFQTDLIATAKKMDRDGVRICTIGNIEFLVAVNEIKGLGGKYVSVLHYSMVKHSAWRAECLYILLLCVSMIVLLIVVNFIVKRMVRRFYLIFASIKEIQKGNLDTVIPSCGTDELGELSTQINIMLKRIKELMKDNLDREILIKNSEIRVLQNQINAHFIYNVLESIKMMAEIEEQYTIADSVTALGSMLRYSMRGLTSNVTVRDEIEYVRNYISLMNFRYDYEIYLSLNIPDMLWDQEIPKMSLQPIVENAINYGIEELAEDTNIYIKGIVHADYFIIDITDQGKGIKDSLLEEIRKKIAGQIEVSGGNGTGIGLKNVQDRIQINFGVQYGLSIASRENCYTKVSIKLPLM